MNSRADHYAIGIARIVLGLMLVYHGHEVFRPELMQGYADREMFKTPLGKFMVYVGKGSELVAGIFLTLGLFTRAASALIMLTFLYITFFVGHGKFWSEDQHPFMFALCGFLFFFIGPGSWSLDTKLFQKRI